MLHPIDTYVSSRLRALRVMRGLSQGGLADKVGLPQQQLQRYENGVERISAGKLFYISEALGVTPGYFFQGLDEIGDSKTSDVDRQAACIAAMITRIPDESVRNRLYDLIKAMVPDDPMK